MLAFLTKQATIFHITQYKCGSQWVAKVLSDISHRRYVKPSEASAHVTNKKLKAGRVYPTVYLTKSVFDEVLESNSHIKSPKPFIVIRDMRDVMVSLYFSLMKSHGSDFKSVSRYRDILQNCSQEEGLTHILDVHIGPMIKMQESWLGSEYPIFRYEDLIADELRVFSEIADYCEFGVTSEKLEEIVRNNSFTTLTGGREPGKEDVEGHLRKGIKGDWQNYFTEPMKDKFKQNFSGYLLDSKYEASDDW
jgi:lipopolysaccharide transport system ATP-binding protein